VVARVGTSGAGADRSGNGVIDADDLAVWKDHFADDVPDAPAAAASSLAPASRQAAVDAVFSGGDYTVLFREQSLTRAFRPVRQFTLIG